MSNVIQEAYMKTIAVSLQKGGTGKTTLAVSLAVELARESGSVILAAIRNLEKAPIFCTESAFPKGGLSK